MGLRLGSLRLAGPRLVVLRPAARSSSATLDKFGAELCLRGVTGCVIAGINVHQESGIRAGQQIYDILMRIKMRLLGRESGQVM